MSEWFGLFLGCSRSVLVRLVGWQVILEHFYDALFYLFSRLSHRFYRVLLLLIYEGLFVISCIVVGTLSWLLPDSFVLSTVLYLSRCIVVFSNCIIGFGYFRIRTCYLHRWSVSAVSNVQTASFPAEPVLLLLSQPYQFRSTASVLDHWCHFDAEGFADSFCSGLLSS